MPNTLPPPDLACSCCGETIGYGPLWFDRDLAGYVCDDCAVGLATAEQVCKAAGIPSSVGPPPPPTD